MFPSPVHLIAFAHVLVVCMTTNVTDVSPVQPEIKNSVPTSSNNTVSRSDSSETVTAHTHALETNESTPYVTNSPDTQPPHDPNNTQEANHTKATDQGHEHGHGGEAPLEPITRGVIPKEPPKTQSTTTEVTTTKAAGQSNGSKVAGVFFLLLILFIIIILAVVLYILWKKGKRYSFDLTNGEHDTPLRSMEHTGTFEPSKGSNMNLDYIQEDNQTDKTSPVANGCSGETPEQTPCSEQQNVPEEDSFPSDLSLNLPVKKVEFNLDLELIGGDPEPAKEATVESTDNDNENNNNDTNTGLDSAELFTEINLDDVQ